MTPVIGQRIVLSEKQPAIFVIVERGNDFETRERQGGDERNEKNGAPGGLPELVILMRERAGDHTHAQIHTPHTRERTYASNYESTSRCNTRVAACMRVHAVCNARNRYSPIEIR